ncbi:V-type ATP synthase subunit D, partial [Planctomycetota bacterium]
IPYDLFDTPLWVDKAINSMKQLFALMAEVSALEQAVALLREELRITTQRVNLFEKVKIPEAMENMRVINIFLGDEQTAAVVRGKIAKKKIERQAS